MNGNLFALLLIVVLALSYVVRCDVRHAAGETASVTRIQPSGSVPGALEMSRTRQAACPPALRQPQKGGPYGPARSEAPWREGDR